MGRRFICIEIADRPPALDDTQRSPLSPPLTQACTRPTPSSLPNPAKASNTGLAAHIPLPRRPHRALARASSLRFLGAGSTERPAGRLASIETPSEAHSAADLQADKPLPDGVDGRVARQEERKRRRARAHHCTRQIAEVAAPLPDAIADEDEGVEGLHEGDVDEEVLDLVLHLLVSREGCRQDGSADDKRCGTRADEVVVEGSRGRSRVGGGGEEGEDEDWRVQSSEYTI